GAGLAPAVPRRPRGDDGIAEILARGVGKVVKVLVRRRFRGQIASALAARKFSADVELVGFFDVEACAHSFDFIFWMAGKFPPGRPRNTARHRDSIASPCRSANR